MIYRIYFICHFHLQYYHLPKGILYQNVGSITIIYYINNVDRWQLKSSSGSRIYKAMNVQSPSHRSNYIVPKSSAKFTTQHKAQKHQISNYISDQLVNDETDYKVIKRAFIKEQHVKCKSRLFELLDGVSTLWYRNKLGNF